MIDFKICQEGGIMNDYKDKIVQISDPADPTRCQALAGENQCMNQSVKFPDGTFGTACPVHGGARQFKEWEKTQLKNYQLTKFRQRIGQMSNSDNIKSLRDEIGILRMMLESQINRCSNEYDLLLASHKISDMIDKINKLVTSCHKIEGSMGQLLDKQAILQFAAEVVEIVSKNIEDKVIIEKIADEIMKALARDGDE